MPHLLQICLTHSHLSVPKCHAPTFSILQSHLPVIIYRNSCIKKNLRKLNRVFNTRIYVNWNEHKQDVIKVMIISMENVILKQHESFMRLTYSQWQNLTFLFCQNFLKFNNYLILHFVVCTYKMIPNWLVSFYSNNYNTRLVYIRHPRSIPFFLKKKTNIHKQQACFWTNVFRWANPHSRDGFCRCQPCDQPQQN